MCHESSSFALNETLGSGNGTVSLDDLHHADLIFLVGQNPGSIHPRRLTALEEVKRNLAARHRGMGEHHMQRPRRPRTEWAVPRRTHR